MADSQTPTIDYARKNKDRFLEELKEFVSIPSVSMQEKHKPDMQHAADWLSTRLTALGMQAVQVLPTSKHPVVFGEWRGAGDKSPTVLIYGHYDVQPVDPLDLWKTSPYEATQQGDYLFGRGTSDMKGQTIASIAAIDALLFDVPIMSAIKAEHGEVPAGAQRAAGSGFLPESGRRYDRAR